MVQSVPQSCIIYTFEAIKKISPIFKHSLCQKYVLCSTRVTLLAINTFHIKKTHAKSHNFEQNSKQVEVFF